MLLLNTGTASLLGFSVKCVLAELRIVLFQLDSIWAVTSVFRGRIARRARCLGTVQNNLYATAFSFCHGLLPSHHQTLTPFFRASRSTAEIPFRLIVLIVLAETRSVIQRFSSGIKNFFFCRLIANVRRALLCACET